jgi:hypothetical protein
MTLGDLIELMHALRTLDEEGQVVYAEGDWAVCRELIPQVARHLLERELEEPQAPSLTVVPDPTKTHDDFAGLFRAKGYADLGAAFAAWHLPDYDDPYWADPGTVQDREEKFSTIASREPVSSPPAQRANVVAQVAQAQAPGIPHRGWSPATQAAVQAALAAAGANPGRPQPVRCKCGSANMVRLTAKSGPNAGRVFLKCDAKQGGCGNFVQWA